MPRPPSGPQDNAADDAALARLFARPYRLISPAAWRIPFLFASPHSGRCYPASLLERSRLDATMLRRSEDAFVDELFDGAVALGAPLLAAEFPRAYLDANRGMAELDAGMFGGRLSVPVDAPSPRVSAGLGVIPRIVRDGAEIYRDKLRPLEADERLTRLYHPYHDALAGLVEEACARFGAVALIDCHSMPSALGAPDIVLGDRYGASATPALTAAAEEAFTASGFGVARNTPYAGGHTTVQYGRVTDGIHALQIEINRSLYLDEEKIAKRPSFDTVKTRITLALTKLASLSPALLRPGSHSEAAE
jgi:N-formylglutamate deformylase